MYIVGAGLAGLLAAHAWPNAAVCEAAEGPVAEHKALLRFRSDAVARLTGIEFRPVTVRKGIWFKGMFREPNIQLANFYSNKVVGRFTSDRSIWNLAPVERFIAPETFYEQLLEAVGARIKWGTPFTFHCARSATPIISTAPLPITMKHIGRAVDEGYFQRAAIRVDRYRLEGTDVYQTVYFPAPERALYRASITGSMLIVESMAEEFVDEGARDRDLGMALEAFGISRNLPTSIGTSNQRYGKIIPLPAAERKRLLYELTVERNIYSLGRFATWRNVLLDDVVQDIAVLRRLMLADKYAQKLHAS